MNSDDPFGENYRRTRRNDWSTSEEGARSISIRANSQKHKLLRAYQAAGEKGLTDEEAAEQAGLLKACYWKRSSELRDDELIEWTGETRPGNARVPRIVCSITHEGFLWVRRLNRQSPPPAQETDAA